MTVRSFAGLETDATRRAALQIALQLPERVDEARAVLDRASYLLENFLIVGPPILAERSGGAMPARRGSVSAVLPSQD